MRKIYIMFIIMFFGLLFLPMIFFNFQENVTSEIDNRKLTNNPFIDESAVKSAGSFTVALENYLTDRIGFRNFFVRSYTYLNDVLFNKMIHPSYEYGNDGYVFFRRQTGDKLDSDDFYDDFIEMIIKINNYCKERKIPFIFVFEPSKSSVMVDKINSGISYDNNWLNDFFKKIKENNIDIVDNYSLLKEKYENNEIVFNKKYDAGHWNDLGAFYGVNNILKAISKYYNKIHINNIDDFNIKDVIYDTLPVSEYHIDEKGKELILKKQPSINITSQFTDEIKLHNNFRYFVYWKNDQEKEVSPKTLVFQGSYMNSRGYKFLLNSLSEYIAIHNYNNILNFDYYFNIFQPECVVFEVTEYTLSGNYFNKKMLKTFELNPSYDSYKGYSKINKTLNKSQLEINKGNVIVTVKINDLNDSLDYAYLLIDNKVYDLHKNNENGKISYEASILKDNYNDNIVISMVNTNNKVITNYK